MATDTPVNRDTLAFLTDTLEEWKHLHPALTPDQVVCLTEYNDFLQDVVQIYIEPHEAFVESTYDVEFWQDKQANEAIDREKGN